MTLKTFIPLFFLVIVSASKSTKTKEPFKIKSYTVSMDGKMLCDYTLSQNLPHLISQAEKGHTENKLVLDVAHKMINKEKKQMNIYSSLLKENDGKPLYDYYLQEVYNHYKEVTEKFAKVFNGNTEMKIAFSKNLDQTFSNSVYVWDGLKIKNTLTGENEKVFFNIETMKPTMFVSYTATDGTQGLNIAELNDLKTVLYAQNKVVRTDCEGILKLSGKAISHQVLEAQSGQGAFHYKYEVIDISETNLSGQEQK